MIVYDIWIPSDYNIKFLGGDRFELPTFILNDSGVLKNKCKQELCEYELFT